MGKGMSNQEKALALESGDEFEDFPVENWDNQIEKRPNNLWEESWEDEDNLDDNFAHVLRDEAAKQTAN